MTEIGFFMCQDCTRRISIPDAPREITCVCGMKYEIDPPQSEYEQPYVRRSE